MIHVPVEHQYLHLVNRVLTEGVCTTNRTGVDALEVHGAYLTADLAAGAPVLTTKRVAWMSAYAEMIGFMQGLDNAADFRKLGCQVWNANANDNREWLSNEHRKGPDDLGRVYGVQWRNWRTQYGTAIDQLRRVVDSLSAGTGSRREIVTAWNPAELHLMSLPPCHMMMQFGAIGDMLDMSVYIRSNDLGLGAPFNLAQYGMLLQLMAQITGHVPGTLHYFAFDAHVYENHIEALEEQLNRLPLLPPQLIIDDRIKTLDDIGDLRTAEDIAQAFSLQGYSPHPAIKMEMAV
jgi:thymidylate synthase